MKQAPFKQSDDFLQLPRGPRLAGFEFEYTGISLEQCAGLIADQFQGTIRRQNALKFVVDTSFFGELKIEADWNIAQKLVNLDTGPLPQPLVDLIEEGKKTFSESPNILVPWEIVTEPLSEKQLPHLEKLRILLNENRAEGTSKHLAYAFGTHINPEAPSHFVEDILNYLRAFLVAYPTLVKMLRIDPTRRILTFIDPFPKTYLKLVLDPDYRPDWEAFIQDYLEYNNTRNRALDLLPLFVHLFPEVHDQITSYSRSKVKPRPTFHYRLPNSEFGNPKWRIAHAWNSWVAIEELANDSEALKDLCKRCHHDLSHPIKAWFRDLFSNPPRQLQ